MSLRISEYEDNILQWLVAEHNNEVICFCYASKWKGRCAYRRSVETTVYLDPTATSKGWGTKLYSVIFSKLSEIGIHAII